MFRRIAIATLSFACISSNAAHADQAYIGGNLAFIEYSEEGINDDASLKMIAGRFGKTLNENVSAEIRVGVGVGDDTINVLGTNVDLELDHMFGAYLRGGFEAGEMLYPYAALGFTRAKLSLSVLGFNDSNTETDVSFGVGTDININEKLSFNLEYMNYYDKDAAEVSGFSLGLVTKF